MRSLALLATFVVGLMTSAIGLPAPAYAQQGPSTWDHNVCGASGCGGVHGSLTAVSPLKLVIAQQANDPVAIGIQEACQGQASNLTSWLQTERSPDYRHANHFQAFVNTACGSTTSVGYGVAAYARGAIVSTSFTFTHRPPGDELRGTVCARSSTFNYSTCTAHMTPPPANILYPFAQFNEALYIASTQPGFDRFWGGDFYLTPTDIVSAHPQFWNGHSEADRCGGSNLLRPTAPMGKIDYALVTGVRWCPQAARVLDASPHDHHMVGGYFFGEGLA